MNFARRFSFNNERPYIHKRKADVDNVILRMALEGELKTMNATRIKRKVMGMLSPDEESEDTSFPARFLRFANSKKESTREIYLHTYGRISAYMGKKLNDLKFEDITKEWLTGFDRFLQRTSPSKNARNIHLRNIRAVFNEAIDDEVTTFYLFRRFKIRPVATAKRSLSVQRLRDLFAFPVQDCQLQYLDMFKLIFFLIGINTIDLLNLKEIKEGRIEYHRSKTGRFYSIKIEPEAMAIISKYKGRKFLLDVLDRYANYKDYVRWLNRNLQRIGYTDIGKHGKKTIQPLFPAITTYWARHTWATIAASLDIPKETIAAALGHGGNTVTDIYINFDQKKVDEANRRVINWVLYGKK